MGRIAGVAPTAAATYRYQAHYAYSHDVIQNDNVMRITAREGGAQSNVRQRRLRLPSDAYVEYKDRFGNLVRRSAVTKTHREMDVDSSGSLDILLERPDAPDMPMSVYRERLTIRDGYLAETPLIKPAALAAFAQEAAAGADSLLQTIDAVVEWLHSRIVYERWHTSVDTSADQAIALGLRRLPGLRARRHRPPSAASASPAATSPACSRRKRAKRTHGSNTTIPTPDG